MTLYSNNGRFAGGRKPKRKGLKIALIAVLALLLLAAGGVGLFLLGNHNADTDFQKMAAQVQEKTAETTVITTPAETAQTEETIAETTAPTQATQPTILPQYAQLYQQNPDMVGWIKIEGTAIDYPVMHTPADPEKYLHVNFEGAYSYPGVPFVDAACTMDSDNLLIYGHNMPNGTMFRSLMQYQQKNFWQNHPTIVFNTLYEEQEYEVLAAFYDRVYYKTEDVFKFYQFIDPETEEEFDEGIAQFKEKALYDTGVTAEYGDRLITLVTCAYHTDHGRFVVVARRK